MLRKNISIFADLARAAINVTARVKRLVRRYCASGSGGLRDTWNRVRELTQRSFEEVYLKWVRRGDFVIPDINSSFRFSMNIK